MFFTPKSFYVRSKSAINSIETFPDNIKTIYKRVAYTASETTRRIYSRCIQAAPLSIADIDVHVVGEEHQSLLSKKGYQEVSGLRQRKVVAH